MSNGKSSTGGGGGKSAAGLVFLVAALVMVAVALAIYFGRGSGARPDAGRPEAVVAPAAEATGEDMAEGPAGEGGAVYRVGPGEKYSALGEVAKLLTAGDTVLVTGDVDGTCVLSVHGYHDKPVTIRGETRVEGGRVVRPKVTFPGTSPVGIRTEGDWNVIEGLEFTGATGEGSAGTAVSVNCENLTIRNCLFRGNLRAVSGAAGSNLTVEYCEFSGNAKTLFCALGYGEVRNIGKLVVEHCYFHDDTSDIFIYSRYPRNVIRCNWFESTWHSAVQFSNEVVQATRTAPGSTGLRPMHTDIVGNVFVQGESPGPKYDILQLGGESERAAGTEGDYNVAGNLFVVQREGCAVITGNGNIDNIILYNNVFVGLGIDGYKVYERGPVWETAETRSFAGRRGHGEPILSGANNYVSMTAAGVPQELEGTIVGADPGLVDIAGGDYRPRADSPLAGAALVPVPQGRVVELAPEYEPVRGVDAELAAKAREKVERRAIGPYEVGIE